MGTEADTCRKYNLDTKNPNAPQDLAQWSPEELVESIPEKERRIAEIMAEIKDLGKGGQWVAQ